MMSLLGPDATHSGRSHHGDGAGHGFSTSPGGIVFGTLVGSLPPWTHQPRLVRDHHELGPVPGAQLGHGPVDVGLDGEGTDLEALGDLVVGMTAGDLDEDLALADGEGGEAFGAHRVVVVRVALGEEAGDQTL